MGPLGFVNWRDVHTGFCTLMWILVVVLAAIILLNLVPPEPSAHHVAVQAGAVGQLRLGAPPAGVVR
jgi:hypothetical protein